MQCSVTHMLCVLEALSLSVLCPQTANILWFCLRACDPSLGESFFSGCGGSLLGGGGGGGVRPLPCACRRGRKLFLRGDVYLAAEHILDALETAQHFLQ